MNREEQHEWLSSRIQEVIKEANEKEITAGIIYTQMQVSAQAVRNNISEENANEIDEMIIDLINNG